MSVIDEILTAVEGVVVDHYGNWIVGAARDPEECRKKHDSPVEWHCWEVASPDAVRVMQEYLVARGMKNGSGYGGEFNFMYVFRAAEKNRQMGETS